MNENTFCASHTKNCTQGLIVSIFLLAETAVKLRDSQNYEKYQYVLNYYNFFYVFVHLFRKHIIQKYFQITWIQLLLLGGKKCPCQIFFSFSKIKVIFWHHYQIMHHYDNLSCST